MSFVDHETPQKGGVGRPRVHATSADRFRARDTRRQWRDEQLAAFRHALCEALSRGRRAALLSHGPEEPAAWLAWASERLNGVRLCSYPNDEKAREPRQRIRRLSAKALGLLRQMDEGDDARTLWKRVYVGGRAVSSQVWDSLVRKALVQQIGRRWVLTETGKQRLEKEKGCK
jgi:hypothetical protein